MPIAPALVHREGVYTYLVGDLAVEVGSVVRVPFGGRRITGVVVRALAEPDVPRVVGIHSVLGNGVGSGLVSLAEWVARRTLCSLGEALAAMVPDRVAGVEDEVGPTFPVPSDVGAPSSVAPALSGSGPGVVWMPERGGDGASRGSEVVALAASVASGGRAALVLVPEPSSGPVAAAMRASFGEALADLSSHRSARARYSDWLAVRSGRKRVILGGRAAVFAPASDLGLIVIDDESHAAYKEGRAPRYHARAVAAERARRAGAPLVLVGVPPSVEAAVATRRGFTAVGSGRGARLPVTVVDTPSRVVPASTTLREIGGVLAAGGRALILSHRLPLDQVAERSIRIARPARPAVIDARSTAREVRAALKGADLIVASPVIAGAGAPADASVVAIVGADAALARPEFRASEEVFATWWRTCWLLGEGARVLLESSQARHPAVDAFVRGDPGRLVRAEAARRKDLGYPPFGALARIDVPAGRAEEVAADVRAASDRIEVLGPVVEEDRAVIAVKAPRRDTLLGALAPLVSAWRAADEPMRVDVDPWEVFVPRWRSSRS